MRSVQPSARLLRRLIGLQAYGSATLLGSSPLTYQGECFGNGDGAAGAALGGFLRSPLSKLRGFLGCFTPTPGKRASREGGRAEPGRELGGTRASVGTVMGRLSLQQNGSGGLVAVLCC